MTGALLAPLVFLAVVPGLGLPWARRLSQPPAGRFAATPLFGVVVAALLGQACHLLDLPPSCWRVVALAAAGLGWATAWRETRAWARDADTVRLLKQSGLVALGSLASLALVRTHSGGDWIGDWVGHFHRAHYFLTPTLTPPWVLELDPLTARPPLVNLATAVLLATGAADFASHQVFTTLLGLACVPPLLRLARLLGASPAACALLPCALLLHPLFLQNITYAWTKIACAAFVVAGVDSWLRHRRGEEGDHLTLALLWLAAAVLAHYSAAPYVLVLASLHLWLDRRSLARPAWWRGTLRQALPALALASTWIVWACVASGMDGALGGRTTTVKQFVELAPGARLGAFVDNLLRTLVPPPWLDIDHRFLAHGNALASLRDYAFSFYQTCLPGMVGLGALLALGASRAWRATRRPVLALVALALLVVVSVAVHPAPMRWGAGHICLQPLALLFLAAAVSRWDLLPSRLRFWSAVLVLFDAALGVVLHFALQTIPISLEELARVGGPALRAEYGLAFANNASAKIALELTLLGDLVAVPWIPAALWTLSLLLALRLALQTAALRTLRES